MKRDLTPADLQAYASKGKTMLKILAAVILATVGLAIAAPANAAVTFTASVTNANGALNTTLTWSSPGSTGCVASGHTSWTGAKPASGTLALPAITLSGTYTLTLACTKAGDTTATITWVAPLTNTDGGAIAKCASQTSTGPCLESFAIYRGTSATSLTEMRPVDDRNAVSHAWTGLSAGTHYFGVTARNGDGVESALSNIASKAITATVVENGSVTLTVNPIPRPPTSLSVE